MSKIRPLLYFIYATLITSAASAENTYSPTDITCNIGNNHVDYCTTQNGIPVTGIVKECHETASICKETRFKDGVRYGLENSYYIKDNQIDTSENYYIGNNIIHKHYENGQVQNKEIFVNNEPLIKQTFDINHGGLIEERIYMDGKLYHTCKYDYNLSGVLVMEQCFKDDKLDGMLKSYYESGNLNIIASYKNGKLDGIFRIYDESGALKKEIMYKNHQRHGTSKEYDSTGVLLSEEYYENGRLLKQSLHKSATKHYITLPVKNSKPAKLKKIKNKHIPSKN